MLTSLYEGFPVVGVEASASGLPFLFLKRLRLSLKNAAKCLICRSIVLICGWMRSKDSQ